MKYTFLRKNRIAGQPFMFRWVDTDEKTAFRIMDEALDSDIPLMQVRKT
ncbi:hypothetical protein V6D42_02085 [Bacillus sp. 0909A]